MAEDATVPQKRVLPPRDRRESAAKRLNSSPKPPPTPKAVATPKGPTPTKSAPRSTPAARSHKRKVVELIPSRQSNTPVVEDVVPLPTKIVEGQPLPTVRTKQPDDLSIKEYQSIAESAVLAASLHQSRSRWLMDEMFMKYWSKPSKKKGEPQVQNPDAKSMVKLGPCTMVIEPHRFELMMYTVKDPNTPAVQYRPPTYYPPPPANYQPHPPYANSPTPLQARPPYPPHQPIKQEPGRPGMMPAGPQQRPPQPGMQRVMSNNTTPMASPRPGPSTPNQRPPPATNESEKNPVIQKLATAAASDPELKALMKVVASSQATPEQLKTFQGHIDRLNAIIARETSEAAMAKAKAEHAASRNGLAGSPSVSRPATPGVPPTQAAAPTPATPTQIKKEPVTSMSNPIAPAAQPTPPVRPGVPTPSQSTPLQPSTVPQQSRPIQPPPPTPPTPIQRGPLIGPQPPYQPPLYASYPPPPPPQPIFKHIVFENLGPLGPGQNSNPTRFIFPEHAILDFSPSTNGTVILASFLVIRKGSQILASQQNQSQDKSTPSGTPAPSPATTTFEPDEEYFQPCTMRLIATNPKVLETIARAAKPLPACQAWMEEIIKSKTRAPESYLALRLPRANVDQSDGVGETVLGERHGNTSSSAVAGGRDKDGTPAVDVGTDSGIEMVEEEDDELLDVYPEVHSNALGGLVW